MQPPAPSCPLHQLALHTPSCVQAGESKAAVANPGSAYGVSALGPSAGGGLQGGGVGAAPNGTQAVQPMPNEPLEDVKAMLHGDTHIKQNDLALPFKPVALVFKDVHYWVKHPNGKGELELLKASFAWYWSRAELRCVILSLGAQLSSSD